MSKNKGKKNVLQDFTLNDCANAPKPVKEIRKPAIIDPAMERNWDELPEDSEVEPEVQDGQITLVYKNKKKNTEPPLDNRPGKEYPEIIFYLLSKYIKPEDIASFARINKSAYLVTKSKAFWMLQYKRHCENHPKLPEKLRFESLKSYGLRQTVIRSLYHTYDVLNYRIVRKEIPPNRLVSWVCVNVWYNRGLTYWNVYFKLKRPQMYEKRISVDEDLIEEMGRIDANPEEGAQVLMVTCKGFDRIPPLQGMTLSAVTMALSHGYRHHTLYLGFSSSCYTFKGIVPEHELILDAVVRVLVCDWWHPQYPHSGNFVPRQDPPLLLKDFFDDEDGS
ncbi:putative transmembrane protein 183BP isoform X1 [Spodoptera frugiperda]|uniref:Transmembrane protein 183BP isoform X1 n=2 Tax=Spodoptera frugiperda TaxID=7108 RepID=A0A9R0ESB4_SPOFR|nr:putative transmembrane protein 183BP isoform X1 [Spodoptera frugiperda]